MNKIIFSFLLLFVSLACNAQDNDKVYKNDEVDKQAEFPGGFQSFLMTVNRNFRIPTINKSANYKIYTAFIVEKDGSLSDVHVKNEVDKAFGDEAVRVVKMIKEKWSPAIKDGIPVRSLMVFPISINIK